MSDKIYEAFLERQLSEGLALARNSDILKLFPVSANPPQHYIAEFAAKGLVQDENDQIVEFGRFAVGIFFRDDYLRRVEIPVTLTYLGPAAKPWHPQIRPPFICLHVEPGTPLISILYGLHELWTWNLYGLADEGLNHGTTQWARGQDLKRRFPIDRRPLKRRRRNLSTDPPPEAPKQ